jgi:hypothetical protein
MAFPGDVKNGPPELPGFKPRAVSMETGGRHPSRGGREEGDGLHPYKEKDIGKKGFPIKHMIDKKHICVCICLFKRPRLLSSLSAELEKKAGSVVCHHDMIVLYRRAYRPLY